MSLKIIFRNKQWGVTARTLRCMDSRHSYVIQRRDLFRDWPDYSWHQQLGGKGWCDIELFIEAFRVAAGQLHTPEKVLKEMEERGREDFCSEIFFMHELRRKGAPRILGMSEMTEVENRAKALRNVLGSKEMDTARQWFDEIWSRT